MFSQVTTFLNARVFQTKPVTDVAELEPWMMLERTKQDDAVTEMVPPCSSRDTHEFPLGESLPRREPDRGSTIQQPSNRGMVYQPPPKTDTLFWCVYALAHGQPQSTDRNIEIQEKTALVKWVTDNRVSVLQNGQSLRPVRFLQNKPGFQPGTKPLSKTKLQEYMADILSLPKTTWGALYLWCLYYKMNVQVIHESERMYMEFVGTEDEDVPTHTIFRNKNSKIGGSDTFRVSSMEKDVSSLVKQDFRQPTPLKGMTGYKVQDLKLLAMRVGRSTTGTKQEVYDEVYKALSW
jgi:hypothetical protein